MGYDWHTKLSMLPPWLPLALALSRPVPLSALCRIPLWTGGRRTFPPMEHTSGRAPDDWLLHHETHWAPEHRANLIIHPKLLLLHIIHQSALGGILQPFEALIANNPLQWWTRGSFTFKDNSWCFKLTCCHVLYLVLCATMFTDIVPVWLPPHGICSMVYLSVILLLWPHVYMFYPFFHE